MKLLTPYDIAERLQVSYDTALEFIKSSGISYIQVGRQYRVAENAFNAFVSCGQPKTVKLKTKDIYNKVNNSMLSQKRRI